MLTIVCLRVQRDSERVEGQEEGGRQPAQARRGTPAPGSGTQRPGWQPASASTRAIPTTHDAAADAWRSAVATHWVPACRRPGTGSIPPTAAAGRRCFPVRQQRADVQRARLPSEPIRARRHAIPAACVSLRPRVATRYADSRQDSEQAPAQAYQQQ